MTTVAAEPAARPVRVVVVDDHALVREGTAQLLDRAPELTVVGQASSAEEAMSVLITHEPDVALVDVNLPGRSGLELARWVARHQPRTRVVILSAHDDNEFVEGAIDAGVSGYMMKTVSTAELIEAVRAAAEGIFVLDRSLSRRLARSGPSAATSPVATLTGREADVLRLLGAGMPNKRIAAELGLGVRTVEGYVSTVLGKLGVASRTEAALMTLEQHILAPRDHAGRSGAT
ncbi:MAG: response regulator transcription factor [Actinomycetota bacterium]|nr:response regulator transcription factor [Actinomycetota bacterium]